MMISSELSENFASIFQIFISDENSEPPELLQPAIASVKQCFGAYRYIRHDGESLRAFLQQSFEPAVVAAYDKLRPYAYKADLGRYCLLYQFGGWYADISIQMRQPVGPVGKEVELVYFFDLGDGVVPGRSLFDVSNSLIYSTPQHPVMERAIQTVIRHCQDEYYGNTIYSPTGPSVLGAAIASETASQKHVSGHLMALTPSHPRRNLSFVLPDGQILALFKKGWMAPGDVLFGPREGTNNYADLWVQRKVYC
ncbi:MULTISPECIES: glycosyltransferase family 32 protein [Prochlorococcus]|uniref:glycosyltransferase family 32 protein n=1 Tax=Prochlorococcus TaxID=1218 RepID=UPI0007B3CA27|nr:MULTISPECIES: glycosyltransferase [Prochlorococcus]NMP05480.1 hypothetical protein [Prochlorococcus sp. P1361]NMP13058.1 hypothetical protein [Prochlorococcus sp.P1363]